ncbi:hypothetical protein BC567DRAFT_249245 [Phyllosticta citribraziliensis]
MASGYSSDHDSKAPPSRQTSSETIFMTPQPSSPARSSRHGTPSTPGDPDASPPPLHSESSPDSVGDNAFSFDPRRLTPTLQANLVAEILNLRRDINSKNRIIEDLETSLESSQNETQDLHTRLSASQSESRAAKRHVKTLETDTFTTLEELAHERDQAKAETEMLRNKLEDTRKKARNEGDASDRTQDLWQKDKDTWDAEKRSLERRIHVSETRLKAVLEELAAQQAAAQECFETETEENIRDSGFAMESDGVSLPPQSLSNSPKRTLSQRSRHERNHSGGSMRSFRRNRASVLTVGSELQQKLSGPSLADELALDEEDEEEIEEEEEEEADLDDGLDSEDYSENELRARRALELRQSQLPDGKARKMLGLETDGKQSTSEHESDAKEAKQSVDNVSIGRQSLDKSAKPSREVVQPKHEYVDTGVQPSPPPSPKVAPQVMAAARNSGHIVSAMSALKSMRHKSVEATEDKYPGHNDDGPLTTESTDGIRRPFRSSSLFAGFDEEAVADESDDEQRRENSTYSRMTKYHSRLAKPPTPVPEEKEPPSRPRSSCSAKVEKSPPIRRQSSLRRSNMSPTRVSQGLGESSKLASARPPYPVPIRSSSRKLPLSRSEGSQSPPIRNNMLANRRSRKDSTARQDSLRKVRSAAVMRRSDRFPGRSPPPPKTSLTSPTGSQTQSPVGQDRVSTPKQSRPEGRAHRSQHSRSTANQDSNHSPESPSQSISVVDAIAITMVGEWMWKYVRGRKSFGVSDSVSPDFGKDDGTGNTGINGVRHKRWVWISPYERSILWSSKQPTNNTGLMGKPGRKLDRNLCSTDLY